MKLDLTFPVDPAAPAGAAFAATTADPAKRTLVGTAVPFGVPSGPSQDGARYQFSGPPSNLDELIDVVDEHDDTAVIGRLAEPFTADETKLAARARVFNTTRGNDALVEVGEQLRTGFSVRAGFDNFTELDNGVRVVDEWVALHLGVVRRPAFTESAGLTLAASHQKEGSTVTDTTTTTAAAGEQAAQTASASAGAAQLVELPTVAELAASVAEHLEKLGKSSKHPLARFASHADYLREFMAADEPKRKELQAAFAMVDQVTGDNAGVMPPGWRTDIKMNLDDRRPAVKLTGGSIGLPDAGMDSSWPYFDGDLDGVIAQQLNEKTELNSVKISIKKQTEPIKTAGVVSDISYQLLMRSTPAYLAAYQSICNAAWARYTEAVFEAALLARGTRIAALPADLTGQAGADAVRAQLFQGSAAVRTATGLPAAGALVDTATFLALGGNSALVAPQYGTQNAAGNADASSLRININGLEVEEAPFFPASTMLLTNAAAAKFAEQGPMTATEEDVAKLGRNVAVWGMYEDIEAYFPAGIVYFDPAA